MFIMATLLAWGAGALAQAQQPAEVEALYRAQTIITGQDNLPERERGFRETLSEVILRLTADPAAPAGPAGEELLSVAGQFVAEFELEDRKKGIQIADEQGSRDRSYFLRVRFDRDLLKPAMESAGLPVWEGPRPRLAVLLGIDDSQRRYVLTETSERGYGQRETLRSLAARRVLPLSLPAEPAPLAFEDLARPDPRRIQSAAKDLDAGLVLAGTLVLGEGGLWTLDWTVYPGSGAAGGRVDRASFDVALRAAVDGALAHARSNDTQGP